MNDSLRYPVGKFIFGGPADAKNIPNWIEDIQQLPNRIKEVTQNWTPALFQNVYRPEGWSGAQVIHHLADSHANAYIRFKLALTEKVPTVKPYDESAWAELPDGNHQDHPGLKQELKLTQNLAIYSWHCRHHLGHLKIIGEQKG